MSREILEASGSSSHLGEGDGRASGGKRRISLSYAWSMFPLFLAVLLMRFSFAFTVVSLQFIVPSFASRGVISSAYPIMEMATSFFLGALVDKIGRKWVIALGLVFSGFVTLSFTFTTSVDTLAVLHGLQGICAAAIIVSSLALLTDLAKFRSRGREMGAYDSATIIGYIAGFFLAFVIINGNPQRAELPFYAGATIAFIGGMISAALLKDKRRVLKEKSALDLTSPVASASLWQNIKKFSKRASTLALIPTWFVIMMLISFGLTFTREIAHAISPSASIPLLGTGEFSHGGSALRFDLATLAILAGAIVLLVFSQMSFGSLSDRFGRETVVLVGQVSLVGMLSTLVALVSLHANRIVAAPFLAIFGAGLLAFTPAALAEFADAAPETGRGSTMGLYSLTVGAGTTFGPLVGGQLISRYGGDAGLSLLFGIGLLIVGVSLIPRLAQESEKLSKRRRTEETRRKRESAKSL